MASCAGTLRATDLWLKSFVVRSLQIAGDTSITPGDPSEWVLTPEGFEDPLQPLRGKYKFHIHSRGALRDPGPSAPNPSGGRRLHSQGPGHQKTVRTHKGRVAVIERVAHWESSYTAGEDGACIPKPDLPFGPTKCKIGFHVRTSPPA